MPPFGQELLIRLIYDLFVLCLFVIFVISRFGFEGKTLVLIAPVPGRCLPIYFCHDHMKCSMNFNEIPISSYLLFNHIDMKLIIKRMWVSLLNSGSLASNL